MADGFARSEAAASGHPEFDSAPSEAALKAKGSELHVAQEEKEGALIPVELPAHDKPLAP